MKTIAMLLVALAFTGTIRAQDTTSFAFTFDHLALSVKDLDRSIEFYTNVLHLQEITNRSKLSGIRWFSLGEGRELHLISMLKGDVAINKAVHIGLTTPAFDAYVKRLDALHIMYSDWPGAAHTVNNRADGVKQVYFQDPDGYWIEVNSAAQQIGGSAMIQGTWIPVSAELSGQPFPQNVLQTMKLILTDTSYTAIVAGASDIGVITLHSRTLPSSMDILGTEGPNKGRTLLAIYEHTGDTLRICYDLAGKNRPEGFKTTPNTKLFLVEYHRARP